MYPYLKALHIIFVVTWFAGLFYVPRLLIYIIEANSKPSSERLIIQTQLKIMLNRLWLAITWPSAIITLILGIIVAINGKWFSIFFTKEGIWFQLKILLVVLLYAFHFSLQYLINKIEDEQYPYTAQQIRYWNEVPTLLLFAIVALVVVKQWISFFWMVIGIIALISVLIIAIRLYRKWRSS
ncbi:CopD family protein [Sediminibacterium sp.]|uniref:CopD family protein n=1 Tax=Sediminibacterium sp. TaxID=1917865 RepID=UPI0027346775|nr:CopD family protein [Sediminibacterium sp.]MDP3392964.1 CopD family protein [Sediminibacterium sp.]MDP3567170.1 CopD family protein [Sediminibacterium sp.]